jgi:hypothetical protein
MTTPTRQHNESIVEYKTRRTVARKVLRDIHREVDDIEQQIKIENKAKRIIFPILILIAAVLVTLALWPDSLRLLSSLIQNP